MKNSFFSQYIKPHRWAILIASFSSILNKLCDIVPEVLIGVAIDVIVKQDASIIAYLGVSDPFTQLYVVGALVSIFWILESIFEYVHLVLWRKIAQDIQHSLRLDTYNHIQQLEMSYFENKTTGGLTAILNADINQLEQCLSEGPNAFIQLCVNVIAMGGIFFYISPSLAVVTIIPIPFVVVMAFFFQKVLARRYAIVRDHIEKLNSHISNRLFGMTTIKSYTAEEYELAALSRESVAYTNANHAASNISALYIPIVRMGILCGFVASLVIGGTAALQGSISLSEYSILVFLTQRFLWPFTTLTTITDMYERAMASLRKIKDILHHPIGIKDAMHTYPQSKLIEPYIVFDEVAFVYPNGTQLYHNLSFVIPKNKTVAFVGTTGSGKSSIVKLLLRFYEMTGGAIRIENVSISDIKLHDLRAHIGLVSQDLYLINGSVRENIAYGMTHVSDAEIIRVAKMAEVHEFIMSVPGDYDFIVGENGKNLSGGQRQRIAIARALLKNPSILIFDEATSALDNETEAAIRDSLETLANKKTIIIIAHKLSTIRNADTIFVLEKGAILESGTHSDLVQKNGTYAKLWRLQTGA
ncbi:MAG TPA: ABC transporter ATP-binding protein [Candidatus Babeliales bacterium]|nr:ABC transporter ATP-binding protein [Candidatus Babeliales bacterium]